MAQHSWSNLHRILLWFGFVYATAIFLPVTIAIIYGRVSPYVPYISEGGGNFPEAGIFTTFIVISGIFSQVIMTLRYFMVKENCEKTETHLFLNTIALVLGSMSTLSFIVVGAFPTTLTNQIHNAAAGMACISVVIYMFCQTWISLESSYDARMSKRRLLIIILSFIALLLIAVFGVLGAGQWIAHHWVGCKTPKDEGFTFYLVSACAEWVLAILFFLFFATFYDDFKNYSFYFRLEITSKPPTIRPTIAAISA